MTEHKNISATSYALTLDPLDIEVSLPTVFNMTERGRKLFIPVLINKFRIISLIDSGSDLSLMQLNLYNKICQDSDKINPSGIIHINSYSNHKVKVYGEYHLNLKFSRTQRSVPFTVFIVSDTPQSPSLLLGNDLLEKYLGVIAYSGAKNSPTPEVIFKVPDLIQCRVYYEVPNQQYLCQTRVDLKPREMTETIFYLKPAAPVIRTDFILITACTYESLTVIPSRSDLTFDSEKDCYFATGCVVYSGKIALKDCIIEAKFEIINNYETVPLVGQAEKLKRVVSDFPLGREILPTRVGTFEKHCLSIHQLNLDNFQEIVVSDQDLAEAVHLKEPTYGGEAEISPDLIEAEGLDIPTIIHDKPEDAIQWDLFSDEVKDFVHDIFIKKYPQVVSLHALDAGNLSRTLGYVQLRLREGEVLPRARRIFHISPVEQRHLDDVCQFLEKFGYITKAPITPSGCHLYGMSSYLVPRSKPNSLGRLIVDFSPVNQLIETPASIIPEISASLQFLQGKGMFSSLDLRYAYLSLRVDEQSRGLTTFLTPTASYQWVSLPTGAANSPAYFTNACNKILHYEPVLDEQGNPVYESKNVVKLVKSIQKDIVNFFDDIVIATAMEKTYALTLKEHFKKLEIAIQRLAFHGAKISVSKCEFAKTKILFLGWYVCRDFIIADPRRIQKVKEFKFPNCKKAVRAFLGLVNSLRRVIPLKVIEQVAILTPLTSAKVHFNPQEKHRTAFEEIKHMLIKEPLFCNLIDEKAEKFLWVDAATSSGVLGAVLAQKLPDKNEATYVPDYLDLDDEVHRYIFDHHLPYAPVKLHTKLPIDKPKVSIQKTQPPNILPNEPLLGFTPENAHDSLFWAIFSILSFYNCNLPKSILELRHLAVTHLRKGILNNKLKDFTFNLDYPSYQKFLDDFKAGRVGPDPDFYLIEALANILYRPIIIISTLEAHKNKPLIHLNAHSERPPLILGVYQRREHKIFKPFFLNKHSEFKLDSLKNKIQIIAYVSKSIPEAFTSRPILDLEVFAILTALYSLHRFISGVPVTLLTDSRVLFYLFSAKIGNSSVKIRRWCLKILSDYPQIKLQFVRTTENLADFLTREGLARGDLEKFNIKNVVIQDFHHELPKETFTLMEWIRFVENNPQYLTINTTKTEPVETTVYHLSQGLDNVKDVMTPLEILQNRLSRAEIVKHQKIEFTDIYTKCLASKDFEYVGENKTTQEKYKLVSDLLMKEDDFFKILIPPSMVGLLLSFTHLLGHKGYTRMLADLESYSFPNKCSITKTFVSRCYACFLSYKGTKKQKLGIYPTPTRCFQEVMMDLCENLNSVGGYSHLLIAQCMFSDFILIHPLKTKTSSEISRVLLYNLIQPFCVEKLHSDNGPGFRSENFLKLLSALGIQVIGSAALHPAGRGKIERSVGCVKIMLKKLLATQPTLNWDVYPLLIAKILNSQPSPKTGFRPIDMVFGPENARDGFFELEKISPPHYSVKSHLTHIETLQKDLKTISETAKEKLTQLRMISNEKLNKHRVRKVFNINDFVFTIDRTRVPGNPRVLKTKLNPSPYIVIKPLWTTTLIKRLSDGFVALYHNQDIKKYENHSPFFQDLPVEVTKVLLHTFNDLISSDFSTLTQHDPLNIPSGLPLFKIDDEKQTVEDTEDKDIWENYTPEINPVVADEIVPEEEERGVEEEEEVEEVEELEEMDEVDVPNELKLIKDEVLGQEDEQSDSEDEEPSITGYNLRTNPKKKVTWDD